MEIWKEIAGFNGVYEVSNLGRVRRAKPSKNQARVGQILKTPPNHRGYLIAFLYNGAKHVPITVQKLVLEAFVETRPPRHDVSHINGVRNDNRLENLCWETSSANHRRKLEHGTLQHGPNHKLAKLTIETVREIRTRLANGEKKLHLAREYGVSDTLIRYVETRRAWMHVE